MFGDYMVNSVKALYEEIIFFVSFLDRGLFLTSYEILTIVLVANQICCLTCIFLNQNDILEEYRTTKEVVTSYHYYLMSRNIVSVTDIYII